VAELHGGHRVMVAEQLQFGDDGFVERHAGQVDLAVGRAQGDVPFPIDDEELGWLPADGIVRQDADGVDLQHVVDFGSVGGLRHKLKDFDVQQIGRLDAIGGKRPHGHLAGVSSGTLRLVLGRLVGGSGGSVLQCAVVRRTSE
jgi:hypothetical protein